MEEKYILPKRFENVRLSNHELFLLIDTMHHMDCHLMPTPENAQAKAKLGQLCRFLEQYIKKDLQYIQEEKAKGSHIGAELIANLIYKPDF